MKKILIIEDEQLIRESLLSLLERNQYLADAVESVEQALELENFNQFDLIISDIRLPGMLGTEVIKLAQPIPVIIMTSFADIESAVDAMKLGAVDYVSKPFKYESLLTTIEKNLNKVGTTPNIENTHHLAIIGKSDLMLNMYKQISKVAKTNSIVIITGESGTGKELIARSIHQQSLLHASPFIAFNCVSTDIDELNAITAKSNQALTLYLDEVAELSLTNQGKLLAFLNANTTNKQNRIIASTNQDLKKLVFEGKFRKDLYFRLAVFQITPPPLRNREDDIALLAVYLMQKACAKLAISPLTLSKDTFNAIRKYTWPGNIRELANCLERAVLMCEGNIITPNLLALDYDIERQSFDQLPSQNMTLEAYFKSFVLEHQNQLTETELAKQLGMSRKTLWERRQKFGIPRA